MSASARRRDPATPRGVGLRGILPSRGSRGRAGGFLLLANRRRQEVGEEDGALGRSRACLRTLCNSRMFPGQLWRRRTSIASGAIRSTFLPNSGLNRLMKCSTRSGRSSARSRSAGTLMVTMPRR